MSTATQSPHEIGGTRDITLPADCTACDPTVSFQQAETAFAVSCCTACGAAGEPYQYKDQVFDGLTAYQGERLCRACRNRRMDTEGVNILVVDDRPGIGPHIVNTVDDRDKIFIQMPSELRGIDGRDLYSRRRRFAPVPNRAPGSR